MTSLDKNKQVWTRNNNGVFTNNDKSQYDGNTNNKPEYNNNNNTTIVDAKKQKQNEKRHHPVDALFYILFSSGIKVVEIGKIKNQEGMSVSNESRENELRDVVKRKCQEINFDSNAAALASFPGATSSSPKKSCSGKVAKTVSWMVCKTKPNARECKK